MYTKILSEYSTSKKKRQRSSVFGKILAYCHQNQLKKPLSFTQVRVVNLHCEDQWHQEKMHFIDMMRHDSDVGKTIFWLKGRSIVAGYQITKKDIEQNRKFWQI